MGKTPIPGPYAVVMPPAPMRPFYVGGLFFTAVFAALMLVKLEVFSRLSTAAAVREAVAAGVPAREAWMAIFQNARRIGHSMSRLAAQEGGYALEEAVRMRLTALGLVQDLHLRTTARLRPDLTLDSFRFEMRSGRFDFRAEGEARDGEIAVTTAGAGDRRRVRVPISRPVTPLAAVVHALGAARLSPGERHTFEVFDPATLSSAPLLAEVIGTEEIEVAGERVAATRATLNFKGMIQTVWIDARGDLLRERGLLGLRLERSGPEAARDESGLEASEEISEAAAVSADREIGEPAGLAELSVRLKGVRPEVLQLNGGRQRFGDGVLTVRRESLAGLPAAVEPTALSAVERAFLAPEPFIQSDHAKIRAVVDELFGREPLSALEKASRLMHWVHREIAKRPVLSLPDALATLEQREGDCNEHAVLYAALARAAGLPARVEAGLVYLKGRFYYHAWNAVHVGRWVTVDAALGQMPADATHLRLVSGSAAQQLDLGGVIGRLSLEIVAATEERP
jgi:hypothetical protein